MRTTNIASNEGLTWWRRRHRDLVLLGNLLGMIAYYWTRGSRIRKAYRDRDARGEIFYLDDGLPESERRRP